MRNWWKLAAVAGLIVALDGAARADWRDDARTADEHSDYATAFRLFRSHADEAVPLTNIVLV